MLHLTSQVLEVPGGFLTPGHILISRPASILGFQGRGILLHLPFWSYLMGVVIIISKGQRHTSGDISQLSRCCGHHLFDSELEHLKQGCKYPSTVACSTTCSGVESSGFNQCQVICSSQNIKFNVAIMRYNISRGVGT